MKNYDFDPTTCATSGTYCSDPCDDCPTRNLMRGSVEAAMTVDEVLTAHTTADVRTAEPMTVYDWGEQANQFQEGFNTDFPVEFDIVYDAVKRIADGECPKHQVN